MTRVLLCLTVSSPLYAQSAGAVTASRPAAGATAAQAMAVSCSLSQGDVRNATDGSVTMTMVCTKPDELDAQRAFAHLKNATAEAAPGLAASGLAAPKAELRTVGYGQPAMPRPIVPVTPPVTAPPPTTTPNAGAYVGEIRIFPFAFGTPASAAVEAAGWRECNGDTLAVSDFPSLYLVIANTFGTGSLGNSFKIPDLRGMFIRGWDHGAHTDPDSASRAAADGHPATGGMAGVTGDNVGSREGDLFASHSHATTGVHLEAAPGKGFEGSGLRSNSAADPNWAGVYFTDARGGAETRPKNVTMVYAIYTGR